MLGLFLRGIGMAGFGAVFAAGLPELVNGVLYFGGGHVKINRVWRCWKI